MAWCVVDGIKIVVECGVPQPLNEMDGLDPKEYALRVVNPRWLGSFEDRGQERGTGALIDASTRPAGRLAHDRVTDVGESGIVDDAILRARSEIT